MAEGGRYVSIVEDEQVERDTLRALLKVLHHRVEENGPRGIELAVDRRSEGGFTTLLGAGGLLVIPLAVAGYAAVTGLLLPLDALLTVFRRRGRRPRLVDGHALAERLLSTRSEPSPATA